MNASREFELLAEAARPERARLLLVALAQGAESLLLLATPWVVSRIVAGVMAGSVPGKLLLAWFCLLSLQTLMNFLSGRWLGAASASIEHELGQRIYVHAQALPLAWHQSKPRGELLVSLSYDVQRATELASITLVGLAPLLITCGGATAMLLWIEPRVGLAVVAAIPVFVVSLKLIRRKLRPLSAELLKAESAKYSILEQNVWLLPLIKSFATEDRESDRYRAQGRKVRDLHTRQAALASALSPGIRWLGLSSLIVLLFVGVRAIASGQMAAPTLVGLILYGMILVQPVSSLAGVYGQVQLARTSVRRLLDILDTTPEDYSSGDAPDNVAGEITLEGVAFSYPGRPPLYSSLDLKIRPGEIVAITGANGAGKSSLVALLLRILEPTRGRILLDGRDLRSLSLKHLRRQIGLVSQQVHLLSASVRSNIAYGLPEASDTAIEEAAKLAVAHEFISSLPLGYETEIGEEGIRLSGGQRQRLALARAILKAAPILILDEATSMFDPVGERAFLAELRRTASRTVILITHRAESLRLADRVLHLHDGILTDTRARDLQNSEP